MYQKAELQYIKVKYLQSGNAFIDNQRQQEEAMPESFIQAQGDQNLKPQGRNEQTVDSI